MQILLNWTFADCEKNKLTEITKMNWLSDYQLTNEILSKQQKSCIVWSNE